MIMKLKALILVVFFGVLSGCGDAKVNSQNDEMTNYRMARNLYSKKDYASALGIYETLISRLAPPYKDSAMFEFGMCLSTFLRSEEAKAALLHSEKSGYRLADAYYNIAVIYYARSKYDSAEHYLDRTFEIDSVHFRAIFLKEKIRVLVGTHEKTI